MKELFDYLSKNPITNNVVSIAFIVIVISITLIYVIAFFQGRDISFWPPSIGQYPHNPGEQHSHLSTGSNSSAWVSRRVFVPTAIGTALGIAVGWSFGQNNVIADSPLRDNERQQSNIKKSWKMITFLDDNHKDLILWDAPRMIKRRVLAMTNGNFNIEVVSGGGDTERILEDVSRGRNEQGEIVQCGYSGVYYNNDKYLPLYFGCAIPFGLTPQEQNAWLYYRKRPESDEDAFRYYNELFLILKEEPTFMQVMYRKLGLNIVSFPAGATGAQMGGWFKEEIVGSTNYFKGKTIRIPGLGARVLKEKYNANVIPNRQGGIGQTKINEIAGLLQEKEIDAAEWVGPYDDTKLNWHKTNTKYYYYPGWWEPGTTFDVQVNIDAWKDLPVEYQEIFKTACYETHMEILAKYDRENSEKWDEIKSNKIPGIEPRYFGDAMLEDFRNKTNELLVQYGKNDPGGFGMAYKEWKDFKKRIREWSRLQLDINKFS